MKKRSLLTLLEGNFDKGFPAILQISSDRIETEIEIQVTGRLPPAPDLWLTLQHWQSAYRRMVWSQARIKAKPEQITNISCPQLGSELKELLNRWLNQGTSEWQKIRDCLQRNLHHSDQIEIVIQTSDPKLQQIPWHLWDFFDHYPHAEIAFSTGEYQKAQQLPLTKTNNKVKILAIFGDRTGLDLTQDRAYLEQLAPQAEIKFLVEPQPEELNDQLWETGWDIFFFAGHSSSDPQGKIWLNQTHTLTIEQLKYALKKAINNGLCLAIFNSCDGLLLARELADLQLGQIVVMRESVPDVVAQIFLKHFLSAFAEGQSLYLAVRTARERLQKLESKYPYATWLPVIFQNSAVIAPTWQNLTKNYRYQILRKLFSAVSLPMSMVATAFLLGMRDLDIWHLIKLEALDIENNPDSDQEQNPHTLVSNTENQISEIITDPFSISDRHEPMIFEENPTTNLVVHRIADLNGDGINEILIDLSQPNDENRKTYVVFGQQKGFEPELDLASLDGNNGFVLSGIDGDQTASIAVKRVADINRDGIKEILIDILPNTIDSKRKAYFIFGKEKGFEPELDLASLDGNNGFILSGIDGDNNSPITVSRIEDLNGDGIDEILINVSHPKERKRKIYIVFSENNNSDSETNLENPEQNDDFIVPSDCSVCSIVSQTEQDATADISETQIPKLNEGSIDQTLNQDEIQDTKIALNEQENFNSESNLHTLDANNDFVVRQIEPNNAPGMSENQIPKSKKDDTKESFDNEATPEKLTPNEFPSEIDLENFDDNDGLVIIIENYSSDPLTSFSQNSYFFYDEPLTDLDRFSFFPNSHEHLLTGSAEADLIHGSISDDIIEALAGNDTIFGSLGNDQIDAGADDDLLQGQQGNDTLSGDSGSDQIFGNEGNDRLIGGQGNDVLSGGEGEDQFVFATGSVFNSLDLGEDRILDFSAGEDTILLSSDTFTALRTTNGRLRNSEFAVVTNDDLVNINNAKIVYNSSNGNLYYNQNNQAVGFGIGGLITKLISSPDNLSSTDFRVIDI